MVDETLILRKLSDLEEYLKQISDYQDITATQYSKDWKTQRIVERTLQMIIETSVDIAGHIISDKQFRIPASYADTFEVLFEEGLLEETLFKSLKKMATFRNIIVHNYDKVDAEIVVSVLQKNLNDFQEYKNTILKIIKNK